MADYKFDVFVSYHRSVLYPDWIVDYFLKFLEEYTQQEVYQLCRRTNLRIFFDKSLLPDLEFSNALRGIEIGDQWKDKLADAIRSSRCMVGLWAPLYFSRPWCVTEWKSFHKRLDLGHPRPVVGVSLHDGDTFPPEAAALQIDPDFPKYVIDGPIFRNSPEYVSFQRSMKNLAVAVARSVCEAPAYQDWPIVTEAPEPVPPIPQSKM